MPPPFNIFYLIYWAIQRISKGNKSAFTSVQFNSYKCKDKIINDKIRFYAKEVLKTYESLEDEKEKIEKIMEKLKLLENHQKINSSKLDKLVNLKVQTQKNINQ